MIFFSVLLLFLSFLQVSLLPVNLVLLILIVRGLVVDTQENFWLAFIFGLLLSLLWSYPLGVLSLLYLLSVLVVTIIKKTQSPSRLIIILPLTFLLILFNHYVTGIISHATFDPKLVLLESGLSLPLYFLITLWEERFIVRKEIKLKVGK